MRARRVLVVSTVGLLAIAGCGDEQPLASATGSGGAAAVPTTGSGGAGTTATSSSSTGGGPPGPPSPISFPDPKRPWVGAVIVWTGEPVAGWRVDGATMPPPSPAFPELLLDTRALADGPHTLSLDVVEGSAIHTYDTAIAVDNAPSVKPAITGKFVDIGASSGLAGSFGGGHTRTGAVAGDIDGDGRPDVLTWGALARLYLQKAPLVFEPTATFIPGNVHAAGMADLDGDGLPEIVAVGDGVHILHNQGGGVLVDVAADSGLDALPPRDFRGVTFADVDGDGLLDIALGQFNCGNVSGAPNLVLRNEGGMRFADIAPALGVTLEDAATFTLAIDVTDADDDLHVWAFHEGCTPVKTKHLRFAAGDDLPSLVDARAPSQNENPMGSALFDADGDGVLDMWISGDVESPLWIGPELLHSGAPYAGLDAFPDADGHRLQGWSQVLFDVDLDGRGDVLATHLSHNVVDVGEAPAPPALFWQRSPGRFRDIAADLGLDAPGACQAAHGVDLDLDGDTDLLIGCINELRVLRNDVVDPAPGRTVVLHGSISNPDGIHAVLVTPSGEKRVVRGGGQPYAGGLVRETVRAPSGVLTVRWPSGIEQKVDVGASPVLHVTEPRAYTVAPRRVDAAAPQPVAIEVDPAVLGDPAANVIVTPSDGAWTKPMAKESDGVWRGTLAAPAGAAANVVISVQVGSTVLRTRPRIYVR